MITLELLQAINDWQAKGYGANKIKLVEKLKEESKCLSDDFKILQRPCYRRLDLEKDATWKMGDELEISETYSSWTFDINVAKDIWPIPELQELKTPIIGELKPNDPNYKVILNLNDLFRDSSFLLAIESNKDKIVGYTDGIGQFLNNEQEVVIECKKIKINQVVGYGGHSKLGFGTDWVTEKDAIERLINGHISTTQNLKRKYNK